MRRLLTSTIAIIALSCPACSGDEGTPGEPAPTPFEIEVEASPTLAKPGSEVTVSAAVVEGATDGELTITWSREGAEDTSGDEYTFTASEPGQMVVGMTARDEAGNTVQDSVLVTIVEEDSNDVILGDIDGDGMLGDADVTLFEDVLYDTSTLDEAAYERADVWPDLSVDEDDLELVRQGASEGQIATSVPKRGSIGARVTIVHQALVTVDGPVTVKFGDAPEQSAFRSRPGYLVAMVPDELTEAQNVELTVHADQQVVATLPFEILDAPQPSADPGAKVFEAVDRLENNLDHLPGLATELLD